MFKSQKKLKFFICIMIFMMSFSFAIAQKRGPSTPEERSRALGIAKSLQADPIAPNLTKEREWLIMWLIEVPDISIKLCTDMLGDLGKDKKGYSGALIATEMASQAAFVIEQPDKAKDEESVYFAGINGALLGYESIRKTDTSFHIVHLDELIQLRDSGKLADYVHNTKKKKCK